ncbi:MAG: GH92 family glycosyl hydrolase [Saprospiraceae bacterium]|nr:GH92 family glycosyl hydrolase [Saprospiraceae bacterium]
MKNNTDKDCQISFVSYFVLFSLFLLISACQRKTFNNYVNPFIGTGGHGHTFPGACYPFGMMQLSPDTRLEGWDGCSGYHYTDTIIYGFSHTHLSGTGIADFGDLLIMPGQGNLPQDIFSNQIYKSSFKKGTEYAAPAYYKVKLEKHAIWAEMTVGKRTGMHRYTFENADQQWLVVDLKHRDPLLDAGFTKISDTGLEGFRFSSSWAKRQKFFFNIQFDKKISSFRYNADSTQLCLIFENNNSKRLQLHVAISGVDADGAAINLEAEWDAFNFEEMKKSSETEWENHLSRINVKDNNHTKKTIFYTALYHNLIHPSLFQDADGRYLGMDHKIYTTQIDDHFTVFSLWDTYRSTHPLYQLVYPDYNARFIRTFLRQYQTSGQLPVWELAANETWCMIGNHSIPVIANAMAHKDFNFDTALAREAVMQSLNFGKNSGLLFMDKGYIASNEESESVSKTIENSLDFAAAEYIQSRISKKYSPFAYRNLYNPATGFLQAKFNQKFIESFDPREVNFHFTEANAYQYLFGAHHDIPGMIQLMGGVANFKKNLDAVFTSESLMTGREQADITGLIGQYAHGNEPSHHFAYLYNYAESPAQTQKYVRRIKEQFYKNTPDGLIGNEDCGQMSSWYVFSALGFYPVHPFNATYDVGLPSFRSVQIEVPGRSPISIKTRSELSHPYVKAFLKNGKFPGYQFSLKEGDLLEFTLSDHMQIENVGSPELIGNDYKIVPYITKGQHVFQDSTKIELSSLQNLEIQYCLDTINGPILDYIGSFEIFRGSSLFFKLKNEEVGRSWLKADFFEKPKGLKLILKTAYANQYAATGPDALIDGVLGGGDYRDGFWQGFQSNDLIAELELERTEKPGAIQIRFLQDQRSWILLPSEVKLEYSLDGIFFAEMGSLKTEIPQTAESTLIKSYEFKPERDFKYLRLTARNAGKMPAWHLGAGGESWLFCDEIQIIK